MRRNVAALQFRGFNPYIASMTGFVLSEDMKGWVLDELLKKPILLHAARELDIDPLKLKRAIDRDEEFSVLVEEAMEIGVQNAENAAWDRGVDGIETIVYKNGMPVMVIDPITGESAVLKERKYSDKLLELVLKSRDDRYGDRQKIELSGQQVLVVPEVDNLEQFREMLMKHKESSTNAAEA